MTAREIREFGVIDDIVAEPAGGAHQDWDEAARMLKEAVLASYSMLSGLSGGQLVDGRVDRYRAIGRYGQ